MSRLARLSGRERALLLVALPLALLFGLWRLAWVPLDGVRAAREAEIAAFRAVAEAAPLAGLAPAPAVPSAPLAARVTASAEGAGLSLTRLEPEGAGLRVLAEAPFAAAVLWIADLEAAGVRAAAVEMERRPEPGVVALRLLLEDAA